MRKLITAKELIAQYIPKHEITADELVDHIIDGLNENFERQILGGRINGQYTTVRYLINHKKLESIPPYDESFIMERLQKIFDDHPDFKMDVSDDYVEGAYFLILPRRDIIAK